MTVSEDHIFSLRRKLGWRLLSTPAELLLGLRRLEQVHRTAADSETLDGFLASVLDQLDVDLEVDERDIAKVPVRGPTVVVANHPFGGIEGIALGLLMRSIRPDVKVMANYLLGRIPEMRELFLLVDPFETRQSVRRNVVAVRRAFDWVASGGALVVFPAGEVSHLRLFERRIADPRWLPTAARIVRRSRATVVPLYVDGRNRTRFHLAGLLHPAVRTALLPRELLARRGCPIVARIGGPIPFSRLARLDDREMTDYLRRRTEILAERRPDPTIASRRPLQPRQTPAQAAAVIDPIDPGLLEDEVTSLAADRLLVDSDDERVYLAEAAEIPNLLREIGRLREITFREVGEGTGREIDLDRFDATYLHIFVWNVVRREVVGAYRLGATDEIIFREGIDGLYTSTLFRFSRQLFEAMGPALELGRSFVRPEYQRSFAGLALLWRGIGEYVVRNPSYAKLFGPVSISSDYRSLSQRMIATFLKQNNYRHQWARWVRPRTPYRATGRRPPAVRARHLRSLDDVSAFIAEIEADNKGVPVLLRQYLKLGGRLLGFNVDPEFSNVLDVLILVDLRRTDRRILGRYMGKRGVDAFVAHHGIEITQPSLAEEL